MNLFQSFVLGLVQGLGEFLPVSSSGHLVLIPWAFKWPDPGLGFDVALHAGTLLAVLAYFRRDLWRLAVGFACSLLPYTRDLRNNPDQRLSWLLLLASVPGALIGRLAEKQADTLFRSPLIVACAMAIFALILLVADCWRSKRRGFETIRWPDALLIGLSQALAIVPGVSRSGSTIAAGLGLGLQRADAARFSFLMSVPIILGAVLFKIRHLTDGSTPGELVVGFVTSAVFGFLAIRYLLRYVATHNYLVFVWYRLALAALVFAALAFGVR